MNESIFNSRRDFLRVAGTTLSATLLAELFPGVKLYAASPNVKNKNHFFVMVHTYGAMDSTLGLDPQIMPEGLNENDLFLEYGPNDILKVGNINLGPAARPLKPFAKDIAVVNGILMATNNSDHFVLNLYMRSGNGRGRVPSFPVELAAVSEVTPLGIIVDQGIEMVDRNVRVSTGGDVLAFGNTPTIGNMKYLKGLVAEKSRNDSSITDSERAALEIEPYIPKIAEALNKLKKDPSMQLNNMHAIAAAFSTGVARQAEINIMEGSNNLDTHSGHPQAHLAAQLYHWEQVTELFKIFKETPFDGKTLFDATTFMVITEFSRTPNLNAAKGKDHNPLTNSIILAGKGINGGNTIGASKVYGRGQTQNSQSMHVGLPLNFQTGEIAKTRNEGQYIRPEHVIRTLGSLFGDPKGMQVDTTLPIIPGLLKT